ncbi:MAG: sugar ABC transporter permease [Chloroflexi bacterium]|nr:sugar ABC transporter permease [Chloroflexota bacterium]
MGGMGNPPLFFPDNYLSYDKGDGNYMTTLAQTGSISPMKERKNLPLAIPASIVLNIATIVISVLLALSIFDLDEFYALGDTVQYFVGGIALVPAVAAAAAVILLIMKNPNGRFLSLALHFLGMIAASIYLLHIWGVFTGFDAIAGALYENSAWLWGLVIAYALYWFAGRLDNSKPLSSRIEMIAVGIGMLALIGLLFFGGILEATADILGKYGQLETWVVTALMVIFGIVAYGILTLGEYFGETTDQRTAWQGWLMLSPNIIGFTIFFAGPLLLSLYLSFTDSVGVKEPNFIGLDNYSQALSLQFKTQGENDQYAQDALDAGYRVLETVKVGDKTTVIGAKDVYFWISLRNTFMFCLMLIPLATIPALLLAVVLSSKIPGMKIYRAAFFLPSVAAVVGIALIWRIALYSSSIGFINYALTEFTRFLNDTFGTSFADTEIGWLSDTRYMMFSMVLMAAWQVVGFNMVLFLAGIQGIPNDLYEAAQVDGANQLNQFRFITLPQLRPTTFFVIVTTIINGLQVFNEPFVLFRGAAFPDEVRTAVLNLYLRGFQDILFGYSSALAWMLFAIIFVVTLIQFRLNRDKTA